MPPFALPIDDIQNHIPHVQNELVLVHSKLSSDSAFRDNYYNKIVEDLNLAHKEEKFSELETKVGNELFSQLSDSQKEFMLSVVGSVSFGEEIPAEFFEQNES